MRTYMQCIQHHHHHRPGAHTHFRARALLSVSRFLPTHAPQKSNEEETKGPWADYWGEERDSLVEISTPYTSLPFPSLLTRRVIIPDHTWVPWPSSISENRSRLPHTSVPLAVLSRPVIKQHVPLLPSTLFKTGQEDLPLPIYSQAFLLAHTTTPPMQ